MKILTAPLFWLSGVMSQYFSVMFIYWDLLFYNILIEEDDTVEKAPGL
jgi:hypothetical protein